MGRSDDIDFIARADENDPATRLEGIWKRHSTSCARATLGAAPVRLRSCSCRTLRSQCSCTLPSGNHAAIRCLSASSVSMNPPCRRTHEYLLERIGAYFVDESLHRKVASALSGQK